MTLPPAVPGGQLHAWGRKPRGQRIWLLHLPAHIPFPDGITPDRLTDTEIRERYNLPLTVLIVRHPEGTL